MAPARPRLHTQACRHCPTSIPTTTEGDAQAPCSYYLRRRTPKLFVPLPFSALHGPASLGLLVDGILTLKFDQHTQNKHNDLSMTKPDATVLF